MDWAGSSGGRVVVGGLGDWDGGREVFVSSALAQGGGGGLYQDTMVTVLFPPRLRPAGGVSGRVAGLALGGRLAVALGLLALGGFLGEPGELLAPAPVAALARVGNAVFEVPPEVAARFQIEMDELVWLWAEPLEVVDGWERQTADGGEPWVVGEVVEWPVRRVRPIYAKWEAGAELILATPGDARRFQYKIDPAFGMDDRLPTIKGMMIRFRLDF